MATIPYTLEPIQLAAAVAVVLTCPPNQYFTSKKVTVTNTSASPVAVTFYKVPSAGTPVTANLLLGALVVPGSGTNGGVKEIYELENQILYAGDTLQAFAGSAATVNLNVSGIMQTT
jgi:hypothetical protein